MALCVEDTGQRALLTVEMVFLRTHTYWLRYTKPVLLPPTKTLHWPYFLLPIQPTCFFFPIHFSIHIKQNQSPLRWSSTFFRKVGKIKPKFHECLIFLVLSKIIAHQYTPITELIYNQYIFLQFTEAAIIICNFEESGCVVLINIHTSGDIL